MSYRKHLMTSDEPPSELYKAVELGTNLAEVDTDCISRQAAIDEANAWLLDCLKVNKQDRSCGLIRRLEDLPPAQPKRGEWNRLDMDTLNCNKCGATFVLNQSSEKMHFCPNCGAEMDKWVTK